MRIGIFGGDTAGRTIDDVVADARAAEQDGFSSYALPQIFGLDAMGVLAIVGREVPRIELATGVVPTYGRHPLTMAQQALTVQAASGGRFVLGIGLSHQIVIENMFGLVRQAAAPHAQVPRCSCRCCTTASRRRRRDDLHPRGGRHRDRRQPPVLVAALGPKMLELAGTVTDGTVTWMTGPATLGSHSFRPSRPPRKGGPVDRPRRSRRASRSASRTTSTRRASAPRPTSRCTASAVVPRDARSRRRRRPRRRRDRRRRRRRSPRRSASSPTRASPSTSRRSSARVTSAETRALLKSML